MTKFFRHIRQTLIMENKTSRYLKYAMGEIILVVIGILIALQINNWNENRKVEIIKQNYYQQILTDLEADKEFAENMITLLDSSVTLYNNYKEIYIKELVNFDVAFHAILKNKFSNHPLKFKTSTINSLISAGDIKLLDPNLREKLARYNARKDFAMEVSDRNQNNALHVLESATMSGLNALGRAKEQPILRDFLKIEEKKPEIFIILEAYFSFKNFGETQTIRDLNKIIENIDVLIILVNEKLEN